MDTKHQIWQNWVRSLQQWGVSGLAADLLEFGGPLNMLAAQAVYLGQPLLSSPAGRAPWDELAHLLEDRAETLSFVAVLREGVTE